MTKEQIIKAWLESLRTAKRKARKTLRCGNGAMCVMGHYLNVIDPKGWRGTKEHVRDNNCGYANSVSAGIIGLEFYDQLDLAGINDNSTGKGFKEEIKWIEENLC